MAQVITLFKQISQALPLSLCWPNALFDMICCTEGWGKIWRKYKIRFHNACLQVIGQYKPTSNKWVEYQANLPHFVINVIYYFCALFWQGVTVCLDAMRQAFPATVCLQKTLKIFYSPIFRQSEAGIPIGPNSSTPASSKHMLHLYTTPAPVYQVGGRWIWI